MRRRRRRFVQPVHLPRELAAGDGHLHVVIVRKVDALIEVRRRPLHFVRHRATSARHQIHHVVLQETLVVVDVPGDDQEAGPARARAAGEHCRERDLVRPRVVIDAETRLDVGDRRMVQRDQHELHARRQTRDLSFQPHALLGALRERAHRVQREDDDVVRDARRVPPAST
jgi:hypothetical protein